MLDCSLYRTDWATASNRNIQCSPNNKEMCGTLSQGYGDTTAAVTRPFYSNSKPRIDDCDDEESDSFIWWLEAPQTGGTTLDRAHFQTAIYYNGSNPELELIAYLSGSSSGSSGIVKQIAHFYNDCGLDATQEIEYYVGASGDTHPCLRTDMFTVDRPNDTTTAFTFELHGTETDYDFGIGTVEEACRNKIYREKPSTVGCLKSTGNNPASNNGYKFSCKLSWNDCRNGAAELGSGAALPYKWYAYSVNDSAIRTDVDLTFTFTDQPKSPATLPAPVPVPDGTYYGLTGVLDEWTVPYKDFSLSEIEFEIDSGGNNYCEGLKVTFAAKASYSESWYDESHQYLPLIYATPKIFDSSPITTVEFAWNGIYLSNMKLKRISGSDIAMVSTGASFSTTFELTGKLIGFKTGIQSGGIVGI